VSRALAAARRDALLREVERDVGRARPGPSKVRGFEDNDGPMGPPPHDPAACDVFGCECAEVVS